MSVTAASLGVWQQLKEAARPVLAYHLLLGFTLMAFCGVAALTEGVDAGTALVMAAMVGTTVLGTALGQVLAFLRVRTWVAMAFGAACWIAAGVLGAAAGVVAGGAGALVFLFLFLLPIAMTGGLWSLETHRATWSIWLPMVFTTATAIVWAEKNNLDANWHAGEKWAVWDVLSLAVFGTTVVLTLVYLVTRETHRLALWRRGPTAPLQPTLVESGAARPRITPLGFVALAALTAGLTLGTALIAPYLWRTGPDNGGDTPTEQPAEPDPDAPPEESAFLKALEQMAERAVEAAKQAAGSVCSLLALAMLLVLGALVAGPPVRRLFVVRHLKEPLWPVPNTTRIEMGWQLVEIALADAGVAVRPGEDAAGLARRAAPTLARLSAVEVHGLDDAAEIIDRVRFGLGVGPQDVQTMERFARWTYDTVWERLSDRQQVACMYRTL